MKFIEVTAAERNVLEELENGARVFLTQSPKGDVYTLMDNKGKHRSDVIRDAIEAAKEAGMLKEIGPGLFEGCAQSFVVVR